MSAIPAYRCNFCGHEQKGIMARVHYYTGERERDPSGSGYVEECIPLDLCPACHQKALVAYAAANPEKWRNRK